MARRDDVGADADLIEPDRLEGAPHPREQSRLVGHAEAEAAFVEAIRSGRLHHAWLIGGPEGIGKATLAYRVGRFLLSRRTPGEPGGEGLWVPPTDPAARQVAARSHPNLVALRRAPGTDKKGPAATIPVDAVRKALQLFGSTAADGGYRVCIVDVAEDLTVASANALLKLVEEPPPRSIFLIVSHAPQRLLPTIRSRCRRLALRPLPEAQVREVVASLGPPFADAEPGLVDRAVGLCEGSVRRALAMLDEDKVRLVETLNRSLEALPRVDLRAVLVLAESLARKDAEASYDLVLDTVFRWASGRVAAGAALGPARLAPLVEVCDKLARQARDAEVFNLDRRPLVIALFEDLAQAVRRAA